MKVALAGNPNSGKTTLFNAITGRVEHVGNWAGVTVEKKEGNIKKSLVEGNADIIAVDLPGAYSLSPFTSEESITSEFVKKENPDVIINIVDATNLSRSLFFTTQLLELGIPVVVALNKSDLSKKKGITINVAALSEKLQCPVIETVSTVTRKNGLQDLISAAVSVKGKKQKSPFEGLEADLTDKKSVEAADKKRFELVKAIVAEVEDRKTSSNRQTRQDAVDRVLAHKWLGIPIF
ncbi:MAG TPA: FeoB small GTPase domain-containing protein, partial [Acetivibrio sp.]|nr:FeoB small GTPase domain-containing protein [Acetivibrio sp.]